MTLKASTYRRAQARLRQHVSRLPREASYLVPLRLFLGLGWLRAGSEKLIEPHWYDGSALRLFIDAQVAEGLVLPFYSVFLRGVDALAGPVGVVVLLGELTIGAAILLGGFTGPALVAGMVLNTHFIMAGETNPSVFYIVIALVVLASRAGDHLGIDGLRAGRGPVARGWWSVRRRQMAGVAMAGAGCLLLLPFVRAVAPKDVIHDPAAVLALLLALGALGVVVHLLQHSDGAPADSREALQLIPRSERTMPRAARAHHVPPLRVVPDETRLSRAADR